ncbi:MAG: hypothetical protein FD152_4627 [Xanthobacteraceae bacterium]|nr:MAG: hypothetical protein FD152_4627 [Xanthobacteraceae bacterium]
MSATKLRDMADEPIHVADEERRIDWARIYRIFMRTLAVLVIGRGLMQWLVICGGPNADGIGFEDFPPGLQASTVFFAVIELVAGVGLWLASAWGGVVWLLGTAVAVAIDLAMLAGMQGWVAAAAILAARQAEEAFTE